MHLQIGLWDPLSIRENSNFLLKSYCEIKDMHQTNSCKQIYPSDPPKK